MRTGSEATGFIWSLGYALASDVSPFRGKLPPDYSTSDISQFMDPRRYARRVKEGDVVWVASRFLPHFIDDCIPRLRARVSLVVSDGDESFPSSLPGSINVQDFLDDARLLTVFAQNADGTCKHPKIRPLPIGLDFHTINRKGGYWGEKQRTAQGQERELASLIAKLPPIEQRIPKAFVDFHLSDRRTYDGTRRSDIFRAVNDPRCIDVAEGFLPRYELWAKKGHYAFSISPHGNGLDCHRTWEDLALGCVVIVKTSALDPLYEGLPVVIVKEWSEITPDALEAWKAQFVGAAKETIGRERLTLAYWMKRIRAETRRALAEGKQA